MYVTTNDMIERFGKREIDDLAFSEVSNETDLTKVEVAIEDASELINSYVAAKHALPLSVVPASLKRICCDLARYFLYRSIKPEDVTKAYENSIYFLKDVAKGIVFLEDGKSGVSPKQADDVVYKGSSARLFSREKMEGF